MEFCTFTPNPTRHTKFTTQHLQVILCKHRFLSLGISLPESDVPFLGTTLCRLNLFLFMIYTLTETANRL